MIYTTPSGEIQAHLRLGRKKIFYSTYYKLCRALRNML